MKIEITGNRCVTCAKFTQYYTKNGQNGLEAIDCGYCGQRARRVRPGDRCSYYHETPNIWFREPTGKRRGKG